MVKSFSTISKIKKLLKRKKSDLYFIQSFSTTYPNADKAKDL